MRNYKKIFIILIFAVFIALGVYFFVSRNYPIAFTGDSSILNRNFQDSYLISYNFYNNSLKANNQDTIILKSDEIIKELKRATLDVLVGQKIIDSELKKRIKSEDLDKIVNEKINSVDLNSDNFNKGTEFIYGTSAENIKNLVLITKAKEEILQGRLILETSQVDFDQWLKQKKAEAKVEILMPGFYWNNGEVGIK
jgi:hypothetical protein